MTAIPWLCPCHRSAARPPPSPVPLWAPAALGPRSRQLCSRLGRSGGLSPLWRLTASGP